MQIFQPRTEGVEGGSANSFLSALIAEAPIRIGPDRSPGYRSITSYCLQPFVCRDDGRQKGTASLTRYPARRRRAS
jgi:hypothetical protein